MLLRFLAGNWLHILIALALGAAVWWIDRNGYERAELAAAKREARITEQVQEMEKRVAEQITALDATLVGQTTHIDSTERTIIVPTITKEIARDPRYSDPAQGISDEMRDAINKARSLSAEEVE